MISRSALTRGSQAVFRRQAAQLSQRGFAAAAADSSSPTSGSYEPTNVAGVKVASRDDNGPVTRLAIVAKAGTRYEPLPGLTVGLEEFAFKVRAAAAASCGVMTRTQHELIFRLGPRTPQNDPPSESHESPSSWGAN